MFFNFILNLLFPYTKNEMHYSDEQSLPYSFFTQTKPFKTLTFFSYKNPTVKKLLWQLKYRGNKKAGKLFAEKIADILFEELSELETLQHFTKPLLIPIPTTRRKKFLRGFNQTEIIGQHLSALFIDKKVEYNNHVLYKIKDKKAQATVKDKINRKGNVKDTFQIKDSMTVRDRNIILFDDILTTGSTLTEASAVLLKAGARQIIWVTVAH